MKKMIVMLAVAVTALLGMYETVQASNKFYNNTLLSDEAYEMCVEIGYEYGVSPELLMAIAETESTGNPKAYNGGCCGLMQVSTSAHGQRMNKLCVNDIYDEYGNILLATDYLLELFEEYEDVTYILDIYNGNSKADRNAEQGIVSEYAEKILERAAEITETRDRVRNAVG